MRLICQFLSALLFSLLIVCGGASASIFVQVRGVVHDPQHRPVSGAEVTLQALHSNTSQSVATDREGEFHFTAVPLGEYRVSISQKGFSALQQTVTLVSDATPVLHFQLQLESLHESVSVSAEDFVNSGSVTPTTLVGRQEIQTTPGADRTNGMQMITSFVPGAYMTHDMLHMRGGHQVSWLIDGVQIPNTNIGSNLGAEIDPKDIDYLDVQRGSYNAEMGDRTYGEFNVVPRSGFDRDREGELVLSFGNFLQTDDQVNFGDHTEKFAYYASLNGNRSDYGLAPPVRQVHHDASNGYGGLGSLLYNRTPMDQFRLLAQLRSDYFQIPYDPDPGSTENQQYDSSGLRDGQHENDAIAAFTWAHTFHSSALAQVSPFYHYNRANYEPSPSDTPVGTTSDRASQYGGLQASITGEIKRNMLQAGVYGFGQGDSYRFGSVFTDQSFTSFDVHDHASGGLVEEFISDSFRPTSWLTLTGGVRESHFIADFNENASAPRIGAAVRVPRINWVFRGFYGRFYQPPPLLTASGPVVAYANSQNTSFDPLHGEHDEEHQFGVYIPLRGWAVDADTFKTRVRNFLDHSNVGESNIYYPVTIDGALIQGWELTVRSPRNWRGGQVHLAYSNQIAKQRGAITGGLVCYPISSADCAANFAYIPVDHDQRNTLDIGYGTPMLAGMHATLDISYGSGFHNGSPDAQYPGDYLPEHTSFDLSLSRRLGERTTVSVNALNVANQRVLLDNSLTFGGFHYSDPRQIYAQIRVRFPF